MKWHEEIPSKENVALELKGIKRCAEVYLGETRVCFCLDKLPFAGL